MPDNSDETAGSGQEGRRRAPSMVAKFRATQRKVKAPTRKSHVERLMEQRRMESPWLEQGDVQSEQAPVSHTERLMQQRGESLNRSNSKKE